MSFLVAIITFVARAIYLGRSFDIFIDEVTYLQIARALGFRQRLELAGQPFFLHPPAWFIIEGGFIRLFNVTGNLIAQIYATRFLVVAFAALSAVLVFLIARRAAGWQAGLVAALLFSLDPFVIKLNSLNMLETSAMAWALAGYLTLISGLESDQETEEILQWRHLMPALFAEETQPLALWRQLLAGLFFGLALLTKEMLAFVTLLPLAVFYIMRWSLPRRTLVTIGGLAVGIYAIYPAAVALSGRWQLFIQEKTQGFVRFAGLVRSTGFKRPGAPSFTQTAAERLAYYGATYLLLALGLLAIYVLLRHGGKIYRIIAVWTACTYAMLTYNLLFGTLEEQFFYYLVVACILADAIALQVWLQSSGVRRIGRPAFQAAIALLVLVTSFNGYQWAGVHMNPNDGFVNVLVFLHQHVPRGQRVASISETGQYVLEGYLSGPWGTWTSVDQLRQFAPDYVLVTPHTVVWNNSNSAQNLLDWIERNGQQIYVFSGRESNVLRLYRLPWASAPLINTAPANANANVGAAVGPSSGTPTGAVPAAAVTGAPATGTLVPAGPAPSATPLAAVTVTATSLPPAATAVPPTATAVPPTATAAPPTATAAQPTATAVPPTATTVPPTATAVPQQAAPSRVLQRTPAEVLQSMADAEANLQTGHLDATIYYGGAANSTVKIDFDLASANGGPRYHLLTSYPNASAGGPQGLERISVGRRAWQRQGNGPWENAAETEGPWGQVQLYLPHAAYAGKATFANGDPSSIQWYDASRDADVVVKVDPETGVPQQMHRSVRSNGSLLVVDYRQWNQPVQISPPGQ